MSKAIQILRDERAALYDDATSIASHSRLASQAIKQNGEGYTFNDGSQIIFDYLAGSVTATRSGEYEITGNSL